MTEPQLRALRLLVSRGRLASSQLQRFGVRPIDMQSLVDLAAADPHPPQYRNGITTHVWTPNRRAADLLADAGTTKGAKGRASDCSRRIGFRPPMANSRFKR